HLATNSRRYAMAEAQAITGSVSHLVPMAGDDPEADLVCRGDPPPSRDTYESSRMESHSSFGPHAAAGWNQLGVFAEAALLKGRDAQTGIEGELFSAYAKLGAETGAGVLMAHTERKVGESSLALDVFNAQAHYGVLNPDGSFGYNA